MKHYGDKKGRIIAVVVCFVLFAALLFGFLFRDKKLFLPPDGNQVSNNVLNNSGTKYGLTGNNFSSQYNYTNNEEYINDSEYENSLSGFGSVSKRSKTGRRSVGSGSSKQRKTDSQKTNTVSINSKKAESFKLTGSAKFTTAGLALLQGCDSADFNVTCAGSIKLVLSTEYAGGISVGVKVDNSNIQTYKIYKNTEITVADNLKNGVHNIFIVRKNCGDLPLLSINKIILNGNIEKNAPGRSRLYIQSIGATALTGLGADRDEDYYSKHNRSEWFDTSSADATFAYPFLTAQMMDADYSSVYKFETGIAGTNLIDKTRPVLPEIYNKLFPENASENTIAPDIIVIDSGSSDAQEYPLKRKINNKTVEISYMTALNQARDFLLSLKRRYPKVKIIWCYGLESGDPAIKSFAENALLISDGEYRDMYSLKLPSAKRVMLPSKSEQQAAAKVLYNKIKEIS